MSKPAMRPQRLRGLSGSVCLQMTPIKDGKIDDDAFAFLCERQIQRGTAALVPLGIYSEAAALDRPEQARAIKLAVEVAHGRVPVIAGSGVNYTTIAVDLAQQAEALGADALLCGVPYYDQNSQDGLFHHFESIQASVGLPVIVYDVPSHTGMTLAADTVLRLAELPKIAGIADATGDIARAMVLRQCLGPEFLLLCGDSGKTAAFLGLDGQGSISAVANIAPATAAAMCRATTEWASEHVLCLAALLEVLDSALRIGGSPAPLKWAMASLGLIAALPTTLLTATQEALLRLALDTIVPVETCLAAGAADNTGLPPSAGPTSSKDPMTAKDLTTPEKIKYLLSRIAFEKIKELQNSKSFLVETV
jgi:4-hydroxy-tetrahydrodipicolinate synthase